MAFEFHDWLACPRCERGDDVSSLAYEIEIVFECHACGLVTECEIGEDTSLRNLNADAIGKSLEEESDD